MRDFEKGILFGSIIWFSLDCIASLLLRKAQRNAVANIDRQYLPYGSQRAIVGQSGALANKTK